ncbi:MAG TPA: hypothetical protein VF491_13030 [Vicinamibacterales bacterium]|jgi:hypothetical protein
MALTRWSLVVVLSLFLASAASAQSVEATVHLASSQWSHFDGTDIGFGGRLTWKPIGLIGIEGDLTWYPGEFPPDGIPFTGNRVEGLFGVTVGPQLPGFRPFVKAGAGFMNVGEADSPQVCIAIYPPPLSCIMGGQNMQAFEFGGGVELLPTGRAILRFDLTDRVLKYPAPSFDSDREVHDNPFWGHAVRLTVGAGWRF